MIHLSVAISKDLYMSYSEQVIEDFINLFASYQSIYGGPEWKGILYETL